MPLRNISPPTFAIAMVERDESWTAVLSFCADVILQKETAKREREMQVNPKRAPPETHGDVLESLVMCFYYYGR